MTEERIELLHWLWSHERTEEDEYWRDELTEEEQQLVYEWDFAYANAIVAVSKQVLELEKARKVK